MLLEKEQMIQQQSVVIDKKSEVIDQQKQRIALLEEALRLDKARLFGLKSEKNQDQGELFDEAELCSEEQPDLGVSDMPKPPKPTGRKGLSKSLPRQQIKHCLSDDEKAGAIDTFFKLAREELDITPAKACVIEHMQEVAVFAQNDKRQLISAALPKHPLPKTIASVNLLAFVIASKYCDGLPLYRLESIIKRHGADISRTSMANWVIKLAKQLQPLVNLMRDYQLSYDYLHMDETRIKVLNEPGRSRTSDKWMWVSRGGPPDKPVIIFDYDPSRAKEVPLRLLEGFTGYLQTDGYAGYNAVCENNGLTHLGCWDHARRKFKEAEKAAGKSKVKQKGKVAKFTLALNKIGKLYGVERKIANLSAAEKHLERQRQSQPLLDDLKIWLDANIGKVVSGSLTHKAIQYTLNEWPKLIAYLEDGRLNISNAAAENAIRPFVIGRKGWLFANTPQGASSSALHYSLVETVKANGLEPFAYYQAVLSKISYAETVADYEALLPWNIKIQN